MWQIGSKISTTTATHSCRDPETAVIHFWPQGGVHRSVSHLLAVAVDAAHLATATTAAIAPSTATAAAIAPSTATAAAAGAAASAAV